MICDIDRAGRDGNRYCNRKGGKQPTETLYGYHLWISLSSRRAYIQKDTINALTVGFGAFENALYKCTAAQMTDLKQL